MLYNPDFINKKNYIIEKIENLYQYRKNKKQKNQQGKKWQGDEIC